MTNGEDFAYYGNEDLKSKHSTEINLCFGVI